MEPPLKSSCVETKITVQFSHSSIDWGCQAKHQDSIILDQLISIKEASRPAVLANFEQILE